MCGHSTLKYRVLRVHDAAGQNYVDHFPQLDSWVFMHLNQLEFQWDLIRVLKNTAINCVKDCFLFSIRIKEILQLIMLFLRNHQVCIFHLIVRPKCFHILWMFCIYKQIIMSSPNKPNLIFCYGWALSNTCPQIL